MNVAAVCFARNMVVATPAHKAQAGSPWSADPSNCNFWRELTSSARGSTGQAIGSQNQAMKLVEKEIAEKPTHLA